MTRDARHKDICAVLVYFTIPHDCHSSGEKQKVDSPNPLLFCKPVGKITDSLVNKEIKIQPGVKPECQMLQPTEPLEIWHWSRGYISKDIS